MKKIIILMLLTNFSMAETINYKSLDESKKDVMKTTDILRDIQIHSMNYELSNFDTVTKLNGGEAFINSLEDDNSKLNVGNITYFIGNKNQYNINTKILLNKISNYEGTEVNLATTAGYVNGKVDNEKINGVNVGILAKTIIPEYKVKISTEHKLNYTNVKYSKGYFQNYLGVIGGLDFRATIGDKLFIEPGIRASYTYNFKGKVEDHNKDIIKLNPNINASIGGLIRLGYNINDKFRLSLGYALDKRIYNNNKYELYDKKIVKDANNYILHDVDLQFEMNMKEKHKFTASVGKVNKGFKGGMSYKYEW